LDVGLELGPARKAILARDLELGLGERSRLARLEQVLGLILEVPEVGTLGERARRCLGIAGHGNLLSVWRPLSAWRAERRFAVGSGSQVGFCPFRGPDAPWTQKGMLSAGGAGRQAEAGVPRAAPDSTSSTRWTHGFPYTAPTVRTRRLGSISASPDP